MSNRTLASNLIIILNSLFVNIKIYYFILYFNVSQKTDRCLQKSCTIRRIAKETAASYLTSLIRQSVSDAIFEMIWPRNVAISQMIVQSTPYIVAGNDVYTHICIYVLHILCSIVYIFTCIYVYTCVRTSLSVIDIRCTLQVS